MGTDRALRPAIRVSHASKCYQVYERPMHRLLQGLIGHSRKMYREFWALDDVSFEVWPGETLGIVGRNGSGKSTLLQLIAGTLSLTKGEVEVNGRVAALLELGSGFNPEFTGRENVYLNASILGLKRAEIDARIEDILAYADIGEFVDQPVRNYSSGMVMRLAFAVMVHVDADVLIIDEALAVGDAFFMQKCMRFLRDFRKRGTMLFVSHDSGAVTGLCDSALWLERGQMQRIGNARNVMDAYLEAALVERQGGGVVQRPGVAKRAVERVARPTDARQALIDRTVLRNDILIFPFQPGEAGFGAGNARISHVELCNAGGQPIAIAIAGECVELRIELAAETDIDNVIVGFYVKDRLGQLLFGDNTVLSRETEFPVAAGEEFQASFRFEMPRLVGGEYFIAVGLAEGTQEQHVIQHWLHEALRFSATGGGLTTGLVGVPMQDVRLERRGDESDHVSSGSERNEQ